MALTVIPLRLSDEVDFESAFLRLYKTQVRSRRQEWLRNLLRAGLQSLESPSAPVFTVTNLESKKLPPAVATTNLTKPKSGGKNTAVLKDFFDQGKKQ